MSQNTLDSMDVDFRLTIVVNRYTNAAWTDSWIIAAESVDAITFDAVDREYTRESYGISELSLRLRANCLLLPMMVFHYWVPPSSNHVGPYWHWTGVPFPRYLVAPGWPIENPGDPMLREAQQKASDELEAMGMNRQCFANDAGYRQAQYEAMFTLAAQMASLQKLHMFLITSDWLVGDGNANGWDENTASTLIGAFQATRRKVISGIATKVSDKDRNAKVPWIKGVG
jgi:hypothetical protein